MPQIIALGVLTVGMLGYFSLKMMTPPPAERAVAGAKRSVSSLRNPILTEAAIEMASLTNGEQPSPGMRDPFLSDAVKAPAAAVPAPTAPPPHETNQGSEHLGAMQPFPLSGSIRPLAGMPSAVPAAGAVSPQSAPWSVTGVIVNSLNNCRIAILRNGDARRFVSLGGMIDDQYRLVGVDRFGVTLAQGKKRIRLKLGGEAPKTQGNTPSAVVPQQSTPSAEAVPAAETLDGLDDQLNGSALPTETLP